MGSLQAQRAPQRHAAPKNLAHVPARVLHRCLDRFEPIALASRVAIGIHDKECHWNSHGFGFKEGEDLVLRVEVAREAKDRDFFSSVPHALDKIGVCLGARPKPQVRNAGPGQMAYLDVAVVRSETQSIGSRRIETAQVLDPLLTRTALAVLPAAQLSA
jgi:hypothetical protein